MDERAILAAIDDGARVVVLDMVVTVLTAWYVTRRRHLIRPGESLLSVAALPTAVTALGGWWGFAILHAPIALYRNLRGGLDVTSVVQNELKLRLAEKAQRAEEEQKRNSVASAPDTPPEVRRARVIELLASGDVENAWSLVSDDVKRGELLGRDEDLLCRLVVALRDKRAWSRAAQVAEILRRDHGSRVTGYLAGAVGEVARYAHQPDGYRPSTPFLVQAFFFVCALVVLLMIAAVIKQLAEDPASLLQPRRRN